MVKTKRFQMANRVEDSVKAAIRAALEEDGLKATLDLSYNDLEYGLEDIFIPVMENENDDAEFDRLHAACENIAKLHFDRTIYELKRAQAIIDAAVGKASRI